VVADSPGAGGLGSSANQFSVPVVEKNGALDIAYVLEECNTSLDHGLRFKKSTNGSASFSSAVKVNKAGQWADNPDLGDQIPNTHFRTPNTVALAYSGVTGTLAFVYTNYIRGQGNGDIDVSLSHDGGMTWSNAIPISLSNGTPARNNQFFPWIAADQSGRSVAMWLVLRRWCVHRRLQRARGERQRRPSDMDRRPRQRHSGDGRRDRRLHRRRGPHLVPPLGCEERLNGAAREGRPVHPSRGSGDEVGEIDAAEAPPAGVVLFERGVERSCRCHEQEAQVR